MRVAHEAIIGDWIRHHYGVRNLTDPLKMGWSSGPERIIAGGHDPKAIAVDQVLDSSRAYSSNISCSVSNTTVVVANDSRPSVDEALTIHGSQLVDGDETRAILKSARNPPGIRVPSSLSSARR